MLLGKISEMGINISIDDFGVGYTSLTFLNRLPISEVKIDNSFIINMDKNENEAMVKNIIELSHSMSCRVVAKGVESVDVLARLRDFGCDVLQGYHIGHPMEDKDIESWMGETNKALLKLAMA